MVRCSCEWHESLYCITYKYRSKFQNYKNYWSTRKSQKTNFFPETMSLNKFQIIRSNFHISFLRSIPREQDDHDPWYKVRPFYHNMNEHFKHYFIPSQNVCIDESMIRIKKSLLIPSIYAEQASRSFQYKKVWIVWQPNMLCVILRVIQW